MTPTLSAALASWLAWGVTIEAPPVEWFAIPPGDCAERVWCETEPCPAPLACTSVTSTGSIVVGATISLSLAADIGDVEHGARFDEQAILTHELGHVVGLDDQPLEHEGTMRAVIDERSTAAREVTEADVALLPGEVGMVCSAAPHGAALLGAPLVVGAIAVIAIVVRRFGRNR